MILDEEMICIYYYKQKELNIIYMSNIKFGKKNVWT